MGKPINTVLPCKTAEVLRERLKNEALVNAQRDAAIAADWFALEEEALKSTSGQKLVASS